MNGDQQPRNLTDVIVESGFGQEQASHLLDLLANGVSPSELQSLLLAVYDRIARQRGVADVFRQYTNDRFVCPSDLCQRKLTAFDSLIFRVVPPDFEAIELSPVAPFGINTVLAHTSQKNVLSTIRNIEVSGDVTSALGIESAKRRKSYLRNNPRSGEEVRLCSSQRSIRLQRFEDIPGFTSHFRVFGAVSAGRDVGHEEFEARNLSRHIGLYLDLLADADRNGYQTRNVEVAVSDIRIAEAIIAGAGLNRTEVMESTQDPSFDLLSIAGLGIPANYEALADVPDLAECFRVARPLAHLKQIETKAVQGLRTQYPQVRIVFDLSRTAGIGYYESLCFKISAETSLGERFPLADGGMTDWTKKLLASRKERLFISGFGSELFCRNYTAQ